ncbi:LysR family transcriptional regulator [Actinomadura rupiterrae]|uniref:LysR family transcriptional regulator n=1 Tax=Actinomadura rupiterrae TaxID=559627 RepID=UPI00264671E6|nr:LysR family transcriptional regulator [Actinomadura rupiterrae]MCP2338808.1 DNA-binding transcriptional LysR family regulator [Actinomadura rupiterrae]
MNGPSTDALTSFAVFAAHLNFTRAAEALHISQPALHTKIRKLSEDLGRPLYRRQGRTLVLTPDGERVARFAREMDDRMSSFLSDLNGTSRARVPVLAAGEGAYLYLLGPAIRRLHATSGVRLVNGDRSRVLAAVRSGAADVGVAVLDVLPADLTTTPLATFPQVLSMPADHPLAAHPTLTLSDLAGTSLIVPPPHGPHRASLERALRAADIPWTLAVEASGWPLILHLVTLGAGLAVVNGCIPAPPGLTHREITDLPPVRYHTLHHPDRTSSPPTTTLLTALHP